MNILQEIIVNIIASLYWLVIVSINKTLKVEIINDASWEKEDRVIFALWHQMTFVPLFHYRYRNIVMFVMESLRGQILGWCSRRLGYQTIVLPEDTMSYASAKGTIRFIRELKKGHDSIIAVDGPLGPNHKVKPGIFSISKTAGAPIVPCTIVTDRAWTIKSRWDNYIIPMPFSRVQIVFGEPYIPQLDDEQEAEQLAQKLHRLV